MKNVMLRVSALMCLLWAQFANADWPLNMPRGVTSLSREIYDLHMLIFYICCVIAAIVFGVMFWSIIHHRKSKGAVAAQFHHSTFAEITWTVIPIIILIVMAIPATQTLIKIENSGDADMTIKVTGYQWKWEYEYLDEGVRFFSSLDEASNEARQKDSGIDPNTVDNYLLGVDNEVVVPVGQKIRFLITAADVLHAWWVPDLGWKRDAIPGFINESWAIIDEPGVYRGQCAELCGRDHAFMPVVVRAVPEEEYRQWVDATLVAQAEAAAGADREWAMDELKERGEQVYGKFCAACHQGNGQGIPGAFPALAGSEKVKGPVEGQIDILLNGISGTAMASFAAQLNDVDIAAVITYTRNAWGNDVGDMVQPLDIKAVR